MSYLAFVEFGKRILSILVSRDAFGMIFTNQNDLDDPTPELVFESR